jgi:aspartate/methionine/tyrosine aminotransferase
VRFNEFLIREAEVSGVPGNAFADSNDWDQYLRVCIAREDDVLESALEKIGVALALERRSQAATATVTH